MFSPWAANDRWGVEITQGLHQGVVVQIESMELDPVNKGQVLMDYHVIFTPAHLMEADVQGEAFQATMNEVINQLLMDAVREYEQNRNNDPT